MKALAIALTLSFPAAALAVEGNPPAGGADFVAQARELYRVAACGGDDAVPEKFDPKIVEAHCQELREKIDEYRHKWVDVAAPVLAGIVPADAPRTVVYPFGGGDLLTALATFPNATEITTISLEPAGDARKIDAVPKGKVKDALHTNRDDIERLFKVAHSKTTNLDIVSHGDLPGELLFELVGLVVHDYEPLSVKYIHLGPEGQVLYYGDAEIGDKANAKEVFKNVEISFRKRGDAAAPVKTFRHFSWNLDDKHLAADGAIMKHLEAKGRVSAMTKAASYLLWWPDFKTMRDYLLANADFMISDSTGIPPHFGKPAGFDYQTWGTFDGPFLAAGKAETAEFKKLWDENPKQDLAFRYGYPDSKHHSHMMVIRKHK
jgi:hypothetical protein